MNRIPETGWKPMSEAPRDVMTALVARYREGNKPTGEIRIQFIRWLPNTYGEWAWRPCWRADGGTVYADAWMFPDEIQKACEAMSVAIDQKFDL